MPRFVNSRRSFKYVYFHETWIPSFEGSLEILLREGICTSIEDYDPQIGTKKKYFCPRCGYPCLRSPTDGKPTRNNKPAYFAHFPCKEKRPCNFRSNNSEGQKYTTVVEKHKAIQDGYLTIIDEWLCKNEESSFGDNSPGQYSGVNEDENGVDTGRAIGRYTLEGRNTPRKITTLQFILDNFMEFYAQDIQLPDFSNPEPFADIFIHASQAHEYLEREQSAIFWGRVESNETITVIDEFVCIAFGYNTHCLYFVFPEENLLNQRLTINDLPGRHVAITGRILESERFQKAENTIYPNLNRTCRRVGNKAWGGFGIFKDEIIEFLPFPINIQWIDPTFPSNPIPESEPQSEEGFAESFENYEADPPPSTEEPSVTEIQHTPEISPPTTDDSLTESQSEEDFAEFSEHYETDPPQPTEVVTEIQPLTEISPSTPDDSFTEPLVIQENKGLKISKIKHTVNRIKPILRDTVETIGTVLNLAKNGFAELISRLITWLQR
jgi:hypothetical protein